MVPIIVEQFGGLPHDNKAWEEVAPNLASFPDGPRARKSCRIWVSSTVFIPSRD